MLIDFLLEYLKRLVFSFQGKEGVNIKKNSTRARQNYWYLLRSSLTYRHSGHIAKTAV